MSAIIIDGDLVHYEVLGRGKPIILLHSWLGSWRYWVPTMQQLAMKYRCYAIDLWGFGDSGKDPDRYTIQHQVGLLDYFIHKLRMHKVVLVGHGLGAVVAAHFAANPDTMEKVYRLALISPPMYDTAPTPQPMIEATSPEPPTVNMDANNQATLQHNPLPSDDKAKSLLETVHKIDQTNRVQPVNPLKRMFDESPLEELLRSALSANSADYEKLKVELSKADRKAIKLSVDAFPVINTLKDIQDLQVPTFTLLGDLDGFMRKPDPTITDRLKSKSNLKLIELDSQYHFPMLEDNTLFVRLLKDFMEAPNIASLELKEEWRRRKR